jgi:hypothetical protein
MDGTSDDMQDLDQHEHEHRPIDDKKYLSLSETQSG